MTSVSSFHKIELPTPFPEIIDFLNHKYTQEELRRYNDPRKASNILSMYAPDFLAVGNLDPLFDALRDSKDAIGLETRLQISLSELKSFPFSLSHSFALLDHETPTQESTDPEREDFYIN